MAIKIARLLICWQNGANLGHWFSTSLGVNVLCVHCHAFRIEKSEMIQGRMDDVVTVLGYGTIELNPFSSSILFLLNSELVVLLWNVIYFVQ